MGPLRRKLSLIFKTLPVAIAALLIKLAVHHLGWDMLAINPLSSGLLAATIFVIGFLISGVLIDYKESEKLPGELAVCLEAIFDEGHIVGTRKGAEPVRSYLTSIIDLGTSIRGWLHGTMDFEQLLAHVEGVGIQVSNLEAHVAPPYLMRLKMDHGAIRRFLTRIRVIKETSFVSQGYSVGVVMSTIVSIGIIFTNIHPFYDALAISTVIPFLFACLLQIIQDLDDPFEYGKDGPDEISLAPLEGAVARMQRRLDSLP